MMMHIDGSEIRCPEDISSKHIGKSAYPPNEMSYFNCIPNEK